MIIKQKHDFMATHLIFFIITVSLRGLVFHLDPVNEQTNKRENQRPFDFTTALLANN